MLVFIIPLKSKAKSSSWSHVSLLCERTVRSVCNQTSTNFKAIIVCNEKPYIQFEHPNLHYLEVDLPFPTFRSDQHNEKLNEINNRRVDKGRKILAGLAYARQFAPSHILTVDSDDCISKHLTAFVKQNPGSNGWFIATGYRYQEGSKFIYYKRNFYRMCGICNILRFDLMRVPETPEYNRGYGYYKYYIDHAKVKNGLAAAGFPLTPLPFPGAVYITDTGENLYFSANRLNHNIFRFFNYRILSSQFVEDFGLVPLSSLLV
jgi:hypothetical protein